MNKEILINEYMKNLDTKDISITQIKKDLKAILQEEPFVELEYDTEYRINEIKKEQERIETLTKIKIYYSEISTQSDADQGKMVEFII